jgi:anaerobic selenocysteine-containing dehydrogenase
MSSKSQVVRSACRGCHGVCQVLVHLEGGRVVKVTGDPESPTSRGYICPKGKAAPDFLYHPDRLKFPLRREGERGILYGKMRYRKYEDEGFQTPSGKIELFSSVVEHAGASPLPIYREPPFSSVAGEPDHKFPLILMSGTKITPFFHSELRQIDALRKENPDPLLEIHPDTAASLGIGEGDWIWVESAWNRVKLRARLFDGIAPDVVNAQHAWWFPEDKPPEYGWKRSNINLLYGDDHFDPDNGSEALKCYKCKVYKV